jgi:hypothetical protein
VHEWQIISFDPFYYWSKYSHEMHKLCYFSSTLFLLHKLLKNKWHLFQFCLWIYLMVIHSTHSFRNTSVVCRLKEVVTLMVAAKAREGVLKKLEVQSRLIQWIIHTFLWLKSLMYLHNYQYFSRRESQSQLVAQQGGGYTIKELPCIWLAKSRYKDKTLIAFIFGNLQIQCE